jgi:hypothetical protein
MPVATAVWLVDNTILTFEQIAEFVGMHVLEVAAIADGEVAIGIKGVDPTTDNQLSGSEIVRCEQDPRARLKIRKPEISVERRSGGAKYTPLSRRQDRPYTIAWLHKNHPELAVAQIIRLVGTTKQTIESVHNRTHWIFDSIRYVDPVIVGLCTQVELNAEVEKARKRSGEQLAASMNGETIAEREGDASAFFGDSEKFPSSNSSLSVSKIPIGFDVRETRDTE